jgi:hypothetical protein
MRRGRRALGGAVLAVVLGCCATPAYATSDFWYNGGLTAEMAIASSGAHSIIYIQGVATNNSFCVAKDQGFAGIGSTTNATAGAQACATSGGFASRSENGTCCYHGWIGNYNNFTITAEPTTRYDY